MGDFSSSDCSWKKMVIAKANNQWISTIRSENDGVGDESVNISNFSLNKEQKSTRVVNVKTEREDVHTDQNSDDEVEAMTQELDPLMIQTPMRRRRNGSGSKNETSQERAARLAKMSAYAAQRLANESPEQRASRLKRMSEYAAKRLSQESSEQRAKRLARMSAYAAKRLAKETPEQRQARLARMSAYAARRQAMKKLMNHKVPESLGSHANIMPNQS